MVPRSGRVDASGSGGRLTGPAVRDRAAETEVDTGPDPPLPFIKININTHTVRIDTPTSSLWTSEELPARSAPHSKILFRGLIGKDVIVLFFL